MNWERRAWQHGLQATADQCSDYFWFRLTLLPHPQLAVNAMQISIAWRVFSILLLKQRFEDAMNNFITKNFNKFNCTRNPLAVDVIFWELQQFWTVLRSTLVVQVYIVCMHLAAGISERLSRVHNRSGLLWFDSCEFCSEIKSWIIIKCGSCEVEVYAFSAHPLQIGLMSISHGNLALLKNGF